MVLFPKEIFAKDNLFTTGIGFGWEDAQKGKMWRIYFKPEWDTTDDSSASMATYAGVQGETPLFSGKKIKTSVSGRIETTGEDTRGKASLRTELPKLNRSAVSVGGAYNSKFNSQSLLFGFETGLPSSKKILSISAKAEDPVTKI